MKQKVAIKINSEYIKHKLYSMEEWMNGTKAIRNQQNTGNQRKKSRINKESITNKKKTDKLTKLFRETPLIINNTYFYWIIHILQENQYKK